MDLSLLTNLAEPKPRLNIRVNRIICNEIDQVAVGDYEYGSDNVIIPVSGTADQIAFASYVIRGVVGNPYVPPGAWTVGTTLIGGFVGNLDNASVGSTLLNLRLRFTDDDLNVTELPMSFQMHSQLNGQFKLTFTLNIFESSPGNFVIQVSRHWIGSGPTVGATFTALSTDSIQWLPNTGHSISWRASWENANVSNLLAMTQGWLTRVTSGALVI